MNELIRLLMEEAIRDVDVVYEDNPLNDELAKMYIPDCFVEAFAKRIIKECLFVCEFSQAPFDINVWNESTKEEITKLAGLALVEKIKKHFGVE